MQNADSAVWSVISDFDGRKYPFHSTTDWTDEFMDGNIFILSYNAFVEERWY